MTTSQNSLPSEGLEISFGTTVPSHESTISPEVSAEISRQSLLDVLQDRIDYRFLNAAILEQALTHKSYRRHSAESVNNEKLEFLGDAVLGLALSHTLMKHFERGDEGQLSRVRASLVNEECLSQIAQSLQLSELLRLGKGEQATGGAYKPRLLASALEAILGAIFVESGFEAAQATVDVLFLSRLQSENLADADFIKDYKTRLQELTQAQHHLVPTYQLIKSEGPEHRKVFEVEVRIGDRYFAVGEGMSKKQAEQAAARIALDKMLSTLTEEIKTEEIKLEESK